MWKVNAGRRSALAGEFLAKSVVAIGWREAGDYSNDVSWDQVFDRISQAYPEQTHRQKQVSAGQIWRFLTEVQPGDSILTYEPATRLYHIGIIKGVPTYAPQDIPSIPIQRKVEWKTTVSRDQLSDAAKGKLGAILTLFTHLMSLDELALALIEQYDSLDEEGRRLLPLTKIFWPA